jgi:hypothetical protein
MKAFGQQQTNQSFTIKLGGMATGFEPLKDKAKVGVISTTAGGASAMLLKSTFGPTIPKFQRANRSFNWQNHSPNASA